MTAKTNDKGPTSHGTFHLLCLTISTKITVIAINIGTPQMATLIIQKFYQVVVLLIGNCSDGAGEISNSAGLGQIAPLGGVCL